MFSLEIILLNYFSKRYGLSQNLKNKKPPGRAQGVFENTFSSISDIHEISSRNTFEIQVDVGAVSFDQFHFLFCIQSKYL